MSIWIYKKDKNGKQGIYLLELPFYTAIGILGLVAAFFIPRYLGTPSKIYYDSQYLIGAGIFLIIVSKININKNGKIISWCSAELSKPYKAIYKTGYIFVGAGIIILMLYLMGSV